MRAQVLPYEKKKSRPTIDWNWARLEVVPESVDVPILGTVTAGQPIEAVPSRQTISIPKDMVGRFPDLCTSGGRQLYG